MTLGVKVDTDDEGGAVDETGTIINTDVDVGETLESPLPKGWLPNTLESKSETAAKNDDAKVPLEFWNSSLAHKLNKPELSIIEANALNIIRDWSVHRIWKKCITKCFCKWLRCNDCHFDSMKGFFDSQTSSVRGSHRPCKYCKTFAKNPEVYSWTNDKGQIEYSWKYDGKRLYKKWYNK
jgi:hypothetical protein